jgi:hypothetical protein
MIPRILASLTLFGLVTLLAADQPTPKSPREALQAFGGLVGDWKCTGTPTGSREEIQKGFWTEKMSWGWQFKGTDAWLKVAFEKGKHFTGGELRYVPDKDNFTLTLTTVAKEKITYVGAIETRDKTKIVTFERDDDKAKQQIVLTLLHDNVYNYRFEEKAEGKALFKTKWKVLATKDGEAFAVGSGKPECIVSGGLGTTAVSFMGKTYYVCCSGCRDEFNADPAKYVKEFEAKKAKKK